MPAGQRIMAMKLFGTALLSLAFFSSCSGDVGAEGTSGNSTTTAPEAPKVVPTSAQAGSGSPTVTGNITKPAVNITTNTTSPANTTQPTSNSTAKTGLAKPSTQNPMATPKPNSTLATVDKSNRTTARPVIQNSTTDTPQKATEATPTNATDPGRDRALSSSDNAVNTDQGKKEDSSYSSIILPVIITLIVISLAIFLLMALYKICLKTTPERQENGTEQAPSDKENVKLISVKTTSPETGMSSLLTLSSYDLPLDMSLPLELFKPMRAGFSREE